MHIFNLWITSSYLLHIRFICYKQSLADFKYIFGYVAFRSVYTCSCAASSVALALAFVGSIRVVLTRLLLPFGLFFFWKFNEVNLGDTAAVSLQLCNIPFRVVIEIFIVVALRLAWGAERLEGLERGASARKLLSALDALLKTIFSGCLPPLALHPLAFTLATN